MAASNSRLAKLRAWFARIAESLKKAWHSTRQGFRNFLDAPFSWTWGVVKSAYSQLARFIRWLVSMPLQFFKSLIAWFGALTGKRVWGFAWRFMAWGAFILGAGLFAAVHFPASQVPKVEAPDAVVYLDQGWGVGRESADRQTYYFTGQGVGDGNALKNMRYDWFVNLELPWGKNRFADPVKMLAYGFQVDAEPTPANPHHLPVGFAKHWDPRLGDYVLDITCATCHTGSLLVENDDGTTVSMRIDGGQGMHAFTAANMPHFVPILIASMTSTLVNPFKFNRFALNVLGPDHYKSGKSALREEFAKTYKALLKMGYIEKSHGLVTVQEGFARTDALTRISNAVFGDHISPKNYREVNAPVNYPPVWDIWKFDWVQYSGSVAQPMARNLGESLGVGARFNFVDEYGRPVPEWNRYDTSTRILDLHEIELTLRKLQPPVWREDLLGEIDMQKAVNGGIAFIRTCQGCHGPHPASDRQKTIEAPMKTDADPHWKMKLLPTSEIGTDPVAAVNFVRRTLDLTPSGLTIAEVREVVGDELRQWYERVLAYDYDNPNGKCFGQPRDGSVADCDWAADRSQYDNEMTTQLDAINLSATTNGQGLNYYGLLMKRFKYDQLRKNPEYTEEKIQELNGFGALDLPQVKMAYKARPLGGMWATAPFLHNGSVRNIYQLLGPQHERDKKFFIGRPEFDPVQLGLKMADRKNGGFWLDTSIDGNANTGHEFRDGYTEWKPGAAPQFGVIGPAYSPEQRYEIIEYLKVHLDDPPLSDLYNEAFTGIVAEVMATMPDAGNEADIAQTWPQGQACNLDEYLGNHESGPSLGAELKRDIALIRARLDTYFRLPDSYACGGKTRYQRGGEEYD